MPGDCRQKIIRLCKLLIKSVAEEQNDKVTDVEKSFTSRTVKWRQCAMHHGGTEPDLASLRLLRVFPDWSRSEVVASDNLQFEGW